MDDQLQSCLQFLDRAPTPRHAVRELQERLTQAGCHLLNETDPWQLQPGCLYSTRRGGTVCAWRMPRKPIRSSLILAAHTDSPGLKVKPHGSYLRHGYALLSVEMYGSPLLATWMGRDLALAGSLLVASADGSIQEELVHLTSPLAFLPPLALHLDREANDSGLKVDKQEHLVALWGLHSQPKEASEATSQGADLFTDLLRSSVTRRFEKLLGFDLLLVPCEPARLIGAHGEFLASPRIDNLVSVYAALDALIAAPAAEETLQLAVFWDHEEIGSKSYSGAGSSFLRDLFSRIAEQQDWSREEEISFRRRSLCLSIDNGHALHPHREKKFEPQHPALLGHGVAIKYHAGHSYATEGTTAGRLTQLAERHGVPYQTYICRGDLKGGSTVGPIISADLGIATIDLGACQLSMHSARELIAAADLLHLRQLLFHALEEW